MSSEPVSIPRFPGVFAPNPLGFSIQVWRPAFARRRARFELLRKGSWTKREREMDCRSEHATQAREPLFALRSRVIYSTFLHNQPITPRCLQNVVQALYLLLCPLRRL